MDTEIRRKTPIELLESEQAEELVAQFKQILGAAHTEIRDDVIARLVMALMASGAMDRELIEWILKSTEIRL